MTHETITHKDVNRFAWYTSRKEALNMAAILRSKGIQVYKRRNKKNNPPDPKGHGGKFFLFRGGLANNLLCIVF